MIVARLTTIDNPHSPFDDYPAWYAFDVHKGYRTIELLARLSTSSEELSDSDRNLMNTRVIDEIVAENVTGMFKKVTKEIPDNDYL